MSQVVANHEVLTLEETASYLRVSSDTAEQLATRILAEQAEVPGSYIRRDSYPSETARQVALLNAHPQFLMGETALLGFARRKLPDLV